MAKITIGSIPFATATMNCNYCYDEHRGPKAETTVVIDVTVNL